MWQGALALIPGFVLTVLIGGAYASYLQQRSWRHQNQSRLDEEERKRATEISTTLSEMIGKCQYRLRRLLKAIEERVVGEASDDDLRERYSELETALADWNDQLTTRRMGVAAYFGPEALSRLDSSVNQPLQEASDVVDKLYRQAVTDPDAVEVGSVDAAKKLLDAVHTEAYELGYAMMVARRGGIGRAAPQQLPSSAPAGAGLAEATAVAPGPAQAASGNGPAASTVAEDHRRQGPSVAIVGLGVFWVICMSLPLWDTPGGDFSGWQLLTSSGTVSGLQWGWLPALAMLAIAVLAAATFAQRWSHYRTVTQYAAIAVGAVSVITLIALGVDATDAFRSYCGIVDAAYRAECLSEESLGFGYYLCIAAAVLTMASGVWAAIQIRQERNEQTQTLY